MLPLTPWTQQSQAPDSNRSASRMKAGRAPARLLVASEGIEPPLPGCEPGVVSIGPQGQSVLPVGFEPTVSALSERRALRCSAGEAIVVAASSLACKPRAGPASKAACGHERKPWDSNPQAAMPPP